MGKLSEEKEKAIIKAYKAGVNVRAIAGSSKTIYAVLARNGVPTRREAVLKRRRELGLSD